MITSVVVQASDQRVCLFVCLFVYLEQVSVFDVDASSGPAHPQRPAVTSQQHDDVLPVQLFLRTNTNKPKCDLTTHDVDSLVGSGAQNERAAFIQSGGFPLKHKLY